MSLKGRPSSHLAFTALTAARRPAGTSRDANGPEVAMIDASLIGSPVHFAAGAAVARESSVVAPLGAASATTLPTSASTTTTLSEHRIRRAPPKAAFGNRSHHAEGVVADSGVGSLGRGPVAREFGVVCACAYSVWSSARRRSQRRLRVTQARASL